MVLGIDVENERVSLGIKQLTRDPWDSVAQRYPLNTRINGKVSSVADFGVFVELEEGIEGLIHISQLSNERVDKPSSLFKVGDEVEALVVQVDSRERRIGLSIKAVKQHEEREEMQAYLKREHEAARFSLEDILNEELRLDRDESGRPLRAAKDAIASGQPRGGHRTRSEKPLSRRNYGGSTSGPMTKRGIIEELLARRPRFSHRQSETIVNAMFEEMASVLARGGRIEIRGFGSFGVKHRRARQGRNPHTGDMVAVAAKRIPFFRAGKELRAGLNGAEHDPETRPRRTARPKPPAASRLGYGRRGARPTCAPRGRPTKHASSVSARWTRLRAGAGWCCTQDRSRW